MNGKRRLTSGILAVLAATVIACGAVQGASGKGMSDSGSGDIYITADEQGTGVRTSLNRVAPAVGPVVDASGTSLQP